MAVLRATGSEFASTITGQSLVPFALLLLALEPVFRLPLLHFVFMPQPRLDCALLVFEPAHLHVGTLVSKLHIQLAAHP